MKMPGLSERFSFLLSLFHIIRNAIKFLRNLTLIRKWFYINRQKTLRGGVRHGGVARRAYMVQLQVESRRQSRRDEIPVFSFGILPAPMLFIGVPATNRSLFFIEALLLYGGLRSGVPDVVYRDGVARRAHIRSSELQA